MKFKFKFITTTLCLLLLSACSSRPLELTKATDAVQLSPDYQVLPTEHVSSTSFALFDVIPIRFSNREARARNLLLERSGGTDLINPKISSSYFWTPIGSFVKFRLTATPIKKNTRR